MTEAEALMDIYDDSFVYDYIYRRYTDYEKSEYIRRKSNRFNKYDVGKYVVTKRPLFKKIVNILYLVDQVNQIRENAINYIIQNKDKSILDKFYFIGHRDSNDKPGEEIKISMDAYGNLSNLPYEMNHVRRSMMRLMQIGRKNCELLNSLNN